MKNLSESEKKVLIFWLIIGIIILLLVFLFVFNQKRTLKTSEPYTIVKDRNRYYTVKGAINKYYSYLNQNDGEAILHILDSNYTEENDLTKENVKSKLNINNENIAYETKIMCSKELKDGIVSYYVSGYESSLNEDKILNNKYYQVILDGNTFLFSIRPILEEVYRGECNE